MKLHNFIVGAIAAVVVCVVFGVFAVTAFMFLWIECASLFGEAATCDHEHWRQIGTVWLASAWLAATLLAGVLAFIGSSRQPAAIG